MNSVRGLGSGGWFDINVDYAANETMPLIPGYFWCEWFDREHRYTHYINDVAVHSSANPVTGGVMRTRGSTRWGTLDHVVALPAFLTDKSRYLMVESLDDKIIDVAFRHMAINARPEPIDDYKTIDAGYDPQDIQLGNSDAVQEAFSLVDETGAQIDGFKWAANQINRRPFDT
jgi:hypothetical protein